MSRFPFARASLRIAALSLSLSSSLAAAGDGHAATIYIAGASVGGIAMSVPTDSYQARKLRGTIIQEHDFSCGSAALATLLTYSYGKAVSEADVFVDMFDHGDKAVISRSGFSLLDMKDYLARHGLSADGFQAPLDKLAEVRLPAIVLLNVRGYLHFVVVEGIQGGRVLLSDPAVGTRALSANTFQSQWNGVFFLVTSDIDHGQSAFNEQGRWGNAAVARSDLARLTVDLATLARPSLIDPGRF